MNMLFLHLLLCSALFFQVVFGLAKITEGFPEWNSPVAPKKMCTHDKAYDVIVLGSGVGGMSAASVISLYSKLLKKPMRVLVLEQRGVFGGGTAPMYAPVKTRKFQSDEQRSLEVPLQLGMHYLATVPEAMSEWEIITGVPFEYHVVKNPYDEYKSPTRPRNQHLCNFENCVKPEEGSEVNVDLEASAKGAALAFVVNAGKAYPQYTFKFVQFAEDFGNFLAQTAMYSMGIRKAPPNFVAWEMPDYLTRLLGSNGTETEGARELITAYAEDLGVWVNTATFSSNTYMAQQFMIYGLSGLKDGAPGFHKHMVESINANDGCIQVNTTVTKIVTEGNKATAVEVEIQHEDGSKTKDTYPAELIISNMGVAGTFAPGMIEESLVEKYGYRHLHDVAEYGVTVIGVNLAFDQTCAQLGFPDGLIHYFTDETLSHDEFFDRPIPEVLTDPDFRLYLLSFGACRQDHIVGDNEVSYLTVMATVPFHWFERKDWVDSNLKNRPESYHKWVKTQMVPRLRKAFYSMFPDAESHEQVADIFTPLTIRDRYQMVAGSYCGTNPEFKIAHPKLKIENLWFVGKDQKGCGVQLSALSGVIAGMEIVGCPFPDPVPNMLVCSGAAGNCQELKEKPVKPLDNCPLNQAELDKMKDRYVRENDLFQCPEYPLIEKLQEYFADSSVPTSKILIAAIAIPWALVVVLAFVLCVCKKRRKREKEKTE